VNKLSTWGTHFGDTNEPASMYSNPVCPNLSTSSILVPTGIVCFSFCNPSLGPTSTMRTWSARLDAVPAKVLRWQGWRAARRADRRHINFDDMADGALVQLRVGLWYNGRTCVMRYQLWRAVVVVAGVAAGMACYTEAA
jgi:hypothetical protein